MLLVLCFSFVFFVGKSCVAAQKSTEIRKYITSADSILSDSTNVGNEALQPVISGTLEDSENQDAAAMDRASDETRKGYLDALRKEGVPPEFEGTPKNPPPAKRPKNQRNLLRRVIRRESLRRSL